MTDCPHGGDRYTCPPCLDGDTGRRLPSWQLVSRKAARWPSRCAADGCNQDIAVGDRGAFWTDRHRPDDGLLVTCALCTPDGRRPPLEDPRRPGQPPPCPACGDYLDVDHRREWNGSRMKPITNPRPARCHSCGWTQHAPQEAARG